MKRYIPGFYISVALLPVLLISGCGDKNKAAADFSIDSETVNVGQIVHFNNLSENADYYQWDFGDGDQSIEENPAHTFSAEGTYAVTLKAIGDKSSDEKTMNISVIKNVDVTIYEGVGIEGAEIGETLAEIMTDYGADTTTFEKYYQEYNIYMYIVEYKSEGLGFVFFSYQSTLLESDAVEVILIIYPYPGGTANNAYIGSNINTAVDAYGTAEINNGDGYTAYVYSNLGIDLYTDGDTDYIQEIDIYEPSSGKKSFSFLYESDIYHPVFKNKFNN